VHRKVPRKETYLDAFEFVVFMFGKPLLTIISAVHDHNAFSALHVHGFMDYIIHRIVLALPFDYHKRIFADVGGEVGNGGIEYGIDRMCVRAGRDMRRRGGVGRV